MQRIATDTNAAQLNEIAALASSQQLKTQIVQKLARVPAQWLQQHGISANATKEQFEPLIHELLQVESVGELRALEKEQLEFVIALRLNEERQRFWETNLRAAFPAGSSSTLLVDEGKGWSFSRDKTVVRLTRSADWLAIGIGTEQVRLLEPILQRAKNGQPDQQWLEAFVNAPKIAHGLSVMNKLKAAPVHVSVSGKEQYVRVHAVFHPDAFDWKHEPWQVPTNLVREPLIGFTAVQGVGPHLGQFLQQNELAITNIPNQLYMWALGQIPFQAFAAFPVENATNAMLEWSSQCRQRFNNDLQQRFIGRLVEPTNGLSLIWEGLPFVGPYLVPISDRSGEFLVAGLFPNTAATNTMPRELLNQILGRTNLIYYDWEITAERLLQWRTLAGLALIVDGREQFHTNATAQKWLSEIQPRIGNTVSELTYLNSNTLDFTRKAYLGLTSAELTALAAWFDSTNFPYGVMLPPKMRSTPASPKP